jgi:hypothetical protein
MKLKITAVKDVSSVNEKGETDDYSVYKAKTTKSDTEAPYTELTIKTRRGEFDKGDVIELELIEEQAKLD